MATYRVNCGLYVGPSYWHGTEVYEPDECSWEGEVEGEDEYPPTGMFCPKCHGLLEDDCHFEKV